MHIFVWAVRLSSTTRDAIARRVLAEPSSEQSIHAAIGRRLALARTRKGMSQAAVAAHFGTVQSRVGKLEIGARRLLYSEALDFARLYGVPPSYFDPYSPLDRHERISGGHDPDSSGA